MALTIPRTARRGPVFYGATPPGRGIDIAVFAYVAADNSYLTGLLTPATTPTAPRFVVVNVASGMDDEVATLDGVADDLRGVRRRGHDRVHPTVQVVGYVSTFDFDADPDPALRDIADVKADIDRWLSPDNPDRGDELLHYNGIFFDSVQRDAGTDDVNLDFYVEAVAYARSVMDEVDSSVPQLMVANAGTAIEDVYLEAGPGGGPLFDRVFTYEGTWAQYQDTEGTQWDAAPGNTWNLGTGLYRSGSEYGDVFGHIVHGCTSGNYQAAIDMAKDRGAGVVFVTDDVTPNPYDARPGYLKGEIDYVNNIA